MIQRTLYGLGAGGLYSFERILVLFLGGVLSRAERGLQVMFGWRHDRVIPVKHDELAMVVDEQIVASHVRVAQHEGSRQLADSVLQEMQPRELG